MKQDAAALRALMKTQGPAKGFYDYDARGSATAYSLSRSQYAVLGMWAAAQNGVEVQTDYWRTVTASWTNNQDAGGGWAYQKGNRDYPVTAGMSAAGVATLYLAQEFLLADAAKVCNGNPATPAIDRGLKWLAENFEQVGAEQGYAREFPFPTLYAVERVGMASGRKYFGGNDWYAKGSEYLIRRQRKDGSWHNKGAYVGPLPDTCFGVLFLARGRAPLLMNKLEWGEKASDAAGTSPAAVAAQEPEWNQRPRDVANLAYWVSSVIERDLNWQVVDETASLRDWHDAPILYVSGTKSLTLPDETKRKLREYVEGGGLVLGHADCAGRAFAAAFRKLGGELFPAYAWRELPADHPIYKNGPFLREKWKTKPSVLGLSNGVRELMLLIPQGDTGRAWQSKAVGGNEPAWQLGADVFLYTVGRTDLRYRGDVQHLQPGIAERLGKQQARLVGDGARETCGIARIGQRGGDAEARQGMREHVVRAAVDARRRNDVPARPHQRGDGEMQGCLPAGGRHRADAALQRRNALFQHRGGRVGNARIDVTGPLEVEQPGGVFGIVEHVGGGLVDGHGARPRRRVGTLSRVQTERGNARRFGNRHGFVIRASVGKRGRREHLGLGLG